MGKKTLCLLLAILLLMSLFVGCSEPGAPATTTTAPTQATPSAEPTGETTPAGGASTPGDLLNFFYMDVIQQQYSTWKQSFGDSTNDYLKLYFGLDTSKALDLQIYNQEDATTWADYFTELAKDEAHATLALYELAKSEGYILSEEAQGEFDNWVSTYEMYAQLYSASNDEFIAANYGEGATFANWKAYLTTVVTAQDYAMAYADSLHFDEEMLRQAEKGREAEFSAYSFATYHLSYAKYPELGTTAEDGSVSFDDDQKQAAFAAAKADADALQKAQSVEQLDHLIAGLPCNSNTSGAVSTVEEDAAYAEINELLRPWLTDPDRKPGDCTVIANETAVTNADGSQTKTLNGYYTVLFTGMTDNRRPLANVRHLLVLFGEDDAAAKTKAEALYAQWQKNPTEENFIALVKENSDDTSAEYGGLFEDLAPNSPYVPEFLDWALDENRKEGDCEIITTQYGYHIMYYNSDDEVLYRDHLISLELEEAAYNAWYDGVLDAFSLSFTGTEKVNEGYIISPAS